MLAVVFVHNIIRRHPACMVMLHKPTAAMAVAGSNGTAAAAAAGAAGAGVDVYDAAEPDPAKSRAVESSLWEVEALRNHASPQVGRVVEGSRQTSVGICP
jgi:U3 small nucleolar RNA-associated protein 19